VVRNPPLPRAAEMQRAPEPPMPRAQPPIRASEELDDLAYNAAATIVPLPHARNVRAVGMFEGKPTQPLRVRANWSLLLPLMIVAILIGVGFGVYTARSSQDTSESSPAPTTITAAAMPSSAPAPIEIPAVPVEKPVPQVIPIAPTEPEPPARGAVASSVRLESTPSGATVLLVEHGVTTLLGTTPIVVSVDSTRTHELMFTLEGHASRVTSLDPSTMPEVAVVLDRAPEPAIAAVDMSAAPPKAARVKSRTRSKAKRGRGILMLSSKPPCEIYIDGKATKLTTPQRSISLEAGRHRVKLVNDEFDISKTVSVEIEANESTKLIRDFTR
jgi:hypothetical protein